MHSLPFGDAKVEQFHTGLRQHDVRRLEVAVDDTPPMSLGKGVSYFNGITQRLVQLQCSPGQLFAKCFAVQVLEDEERESFVITNVVKGADVGVAERSDRAGFVFETQPQLMVARKI
jgi:hypothetical protein